MAEVSVLCSDSPDIVDSRCLEMWKDELNLDLEEEDILVEELPLVRNISFKEEEEEEEKRAPKLVGKSSDVYISGSDSDESSSFEGMRQRSKLKAVRQRVLERRALAVAKKVLYPAEKLRNEGSLLESILFCGPILRQEMESWSPRAWYSYHSMLLCQYHEPVTMRHCLMQLLLAFFEQNKDTWQGSFPSHLEFLAEVVEQNLETRNVALLCVLRDISGYILAINRDDESQLLSIQIFKKLASIYQLEDQETLLALKYLAESYLYDNDEDSSIPWSERENYIRLHALQLRNGQGLNCPDALRYHYAMARTLLQNNNVTEAKNILREVFDRREHAFGEVHSRSQLFIDELLEAYCGNFSGDGLPKHQPVLNSSFIDDLIDLCLRQEAHEEVDILVQECILPKKETNARSRNGAFSGWSHFEAKGGPRIQARLASYNTPQGWWYWEDSRMYFCSWDQITLSTGYPKDLFPQDLDEITSSEASLKADRLERFRDGFMAELGGLHYTINKSGETRVNLTIPFVPYEHFQGTRVYREGFTYFEYLDMIRFIISNEYYRVLNLMERGCGRVLSKKKELPIWSLCTISEQDSPVRGGFFNNVPTGSAILLEKPIHSEAFNMVSSNWLDWQMFTLYQASTDHTPSLRLTSGEVVKCHGYIMGVWTEDGNLDQQWSGLQCFVVDCEFVQRRSNKRRHFLINSGMLSERNLHHTKPAEDTFWEEMNRREKWDRAFEKRIKAKSYLSTDYDSMLIELEKEKEQENKARLEWDAQYARPL